MLRAGVPNVQMFGPPGTLYVYLVYGLHWMLNVVTCETGYPAAVLIRGVDGISGPGRVCSALKIDQELNERPASAQSGLWFEEAPPLRKRKVVGTPRIGVAYAGPAWSARKLRFVLSAIEREPRIGIGPKTKHVSSDISYS
jgi:DNA-3-methyladenine glycosylase